MADLPTWLRIPDGFASTGDPIDANPFPPEDARHPVWREATRRAEEEWARVNAHALASLSPDTVDGWFAALHSARFGVWAQRGVQVVWSDSAVSHFDKWLVGYANATLAMLTEFFARNPPPGSADPMLLDLRNRLGAQIQHWKAEARRYRAEQEEHQRTTESSGAAATSAALADNAKSSLRQETVVDETSAGNPRESFTEVPAPSTRTAVWSDVKIRFLSDLKIQSVVNGKVREPQNYAELGFADARGVASKPRAAWETLRKLAESDGVIASTPTAAEWTKLEKRIQEIRARLKTAFQIEGDPVPYLNGAYRTRFAIVVTPPYEI